MWYLDRYQKNLKELTGEHIFGAVVTCLIFCIQLNWSNKLVIFNWATNKRSLRKITDGGFFAKVNSCFKKLFYKYLQKKQKKNILIGLSS